MGNSGTIILSYSNHDFFCPLKLLCLLYLQVGDHHVHLLAQVLPPRFCCLSYFLEILSQSGYLSDIRHQWLILKMITEPSMLSNNINMFGKESVEKIAVKKGIFLADLT